MNSDVLITPGNLVGMKVAAIQHVTSERQVPSGGRSVEALKTEYRLNDLRETRLPNGSYRRYQKVCDGKHSCLSVVQGFPSPAYLHMVQSPDIHGSGSCEPRRNTCMLLRRRERRIREDVTLQRRWTTCCSIGHLQAGDVLAGLISELPDILLTTDQWGTTMVAVPTIRHTRNRS